MTATVQLTPEQQSVVAHDFGPALVFAVAGAGKTTAMVHRIRRLVREGIFPPESILATSFARKNATDLRQSMAQWPECATVRVRTLHALGRHTIQVAQRQGLVPELRLASNEQSEGSVLTMTIARARVDGVPYRAELETLDRADFVGYVAACKGDLIYPDLAAADLPPPAQRLARQAPPLDGSLAFYPALYERFERERARHGLITFPDMLLTGWELLVRHEALAEEIRAMFNCVLVDEFQDVNLAQSEMLHMLTSPHRHFMAIGDDDQTIYEWRGARPAFILSFAERYQAVTYEISENFRCPAGPIVLANAVIAHNRKRQPKRLRLTQGFDGTTTLETCENARHQADRIRQLIARHASEGYALGEMAVLFRLNAQTPPVEQALIAAGIPYVVSVPFYARPEIATLVDYVRLAWLQRHLASGATITSAQASTFRQVWGTVANRPRRYINRELSRSIGEMVVRHSRPPAEVLLAFTGEAPNDRVATHFEALAEDLVWLAGQLEAPADRALYALEQRLQYSQFLRDSSGFVQTGEGRAAGVAAFVEFAAGQGTLLSFMNTLRTLETARTGQEKSDGRPAVTLSTIHQAKGREWQIVFVPQCNQGIIPFVNERDFNLEEERRLFYVALTRSRRHLHLTVSGDRPASQFLAEANALERVRQLAVMTDVLSKPSQGWTAEQALTVARGVPAYGLESYFERWWSATPEVRRGIISRMRAVHRAVAEARGNQSLTLPADSTALWERLGSTFGDPVPAAWPSLDMPRADPALLEESSDFPVDRVAPGTWLRCDAGWGRVDAVWDELGRPLADIDPRARRGRLSVSLRPGRHQEKAEVDLAERRLYFPRQPALFTCSKCNRFTTADPYLIVGLHDQSAHDGVGARYHREKKGHRQLARLSFSANEPGSVFD